MTLYDTDTNVYEMSQVQENLLLESGCGENILSEVRPGSQNGDEGC